MQRTRQGLVNDIEARKNKISILDKIVFSCEQERKRTEQELQELTAQKDRLEKWITNLLNGEGYSKLKQIVKENVKAILTDNKILLSTAFAALIQTLKADPQLANLIYSILTANNGEQHKDNDDNDNVTKYLESNNSNILDLAEKNYKNLVEALTNNSIANASSNPTLSLPSSSTFSNPFNQSDIYRKEEPKGRCHNCCR